MSYGVIDFGKTDRELMKVRRTLTVMKAVVMKLRYNV